VKLLPDEKRTGTTALAPIPLPFQPFVTLGSWEREVASECSRRVPTNCAWPLRIDVLAITRTTAVVRVEMEQDAIGADYTDFHTLIKLDGTWHIIAKVYHMYEG
jgi:Putative lumazine-binding